MTVGGAVAVTVGARFAAFTVIVVSAKALSAVSEAVSRSTYVPGALKVAVVAGFEAFAKVAVPGPLRCVHWLVTAAPVGRPSSLTVPASVAPAGNVMLWFAPAETVGARLVAVPVAVTVVSAKPVSWLSLAVRRRT
ncbi:MAG: hypothetical protein U0Q55_15025 [Vicinamibacterales bacterium]